MHRGDLVVFSPPHEESRAYVKRVVGLPGDKIKVQIDRVEINGKPYFENYLLSQSEGDEVVASESATSNTSDTLPIVPSEEEGHYPSQTYSVPVGAYFLLGDNRRGSKDSRLFGSIPFSKIQARAFFRYWPPNRMKALP